MSSGDPPTHGKIWVENGKIRVKNPEPGGQPAAILPCSDAEILVSGRKVFGEEPVIDTTPIQIHPPEQVPTVEYGVQVATNGLEATVTILAREGLKYTLIDTEPADRLVPKFRTSSVPGVANLEDLLAALAAKGVVVGINKHVCAEACRDPKPAPFVAAVGEPFVPGKDGDVQFLVPMERIVDLPLDKLQVDFRETVKMPDAKIGQAIAIKRDPIPGTPGKSVTGAVLPAPRCKDPHFRAGKGVEIKTDGPIKTAVALVAGCPMFSEESGVVAVEPVMTYKGDVDLSSGNVRSSGSLNILGSVTDGMKVECEGNLDVGGQVTGAAVKCWGTIHARGNVFKSTITAGKDSSWVRTMDNLFKSVEEAAEAVLAAEAQMKEVMDRKAAGEELTGGDLLILQDESYIERFRRLVTTLGAVYKENLQPFPKPIAEKVRGTRDILGGFGTGIFEKTHAISEAFAEPRIWVVQELLKGKSDVTIPYGQSSTIEASRDIVVTGQGAFYCNLIAGRAVKIIGSPGLMRGGEAKARELIQINAAGGQGAAPTVLSVSREGKIQAQMVHPNTILSIGRFSYRTENTFEAVKAMIQGDRMLVITASGSIEVQ